MIYHHLIFDLDGTLINSEKGIKHALEFAVDNMRIDFDVDRRFGEFIGPPLHTGFEKVMGLNPEEADRAVSIFREYYREKGLYESELYPGIAELLSDLNASGKRLYLATSKYEQYAIQILDHLSLGKFFTAVAGASYRGEGADKVHLLKRILNNILEAEYPQCLMIGDTIFDIESACRVGIAAAGVLYGYGTAAQLREAGAIYLAADVPELRILLLKTPLN